MTATRRSAISSLSRETMNPYLARLYAALAEEGVPRGPDAELGLRWLLSHRSSVRWLHAHWPYGLYRWHRGPSALRRPLGWAKLWLFRIRLLVARLLGYRVAWTIHQVFPHDGADRRLDRAGLRALAGAAGALFAHDAATVREAVGELGVDPDAVTIVPHGSYAGVYPAGRARDVVRAELGVEPGDVVLLCFGEARSDSGLPVLLEAFSTAGSAVRLVVAGNVKDPASAAALDARSSDDRIVQHRGFVPLERVAELYGAADVAVVPRGNGGTSGSLVLALSFGVPVIAADVDTYRDVTRDGAAAWLFEPGDAASLAAAIEQSARSPGERREKSEAAVAAAAGLDWAITARLTAARLR